MKNFYLTTTLPYVNSVPHLGHALEYVQGDARVRFEKLRGKDVFFNTGTDEYGSKIHLRAKEEGKDEKAFVDEMVLPFKKLLVDLNIDITKFIRTTDKDHAEAVKHLWNLSYKNGDIYEKEHTGNYCVNCELFKTDDELTKGECVLHPGKKLEVISEKNYFFKLSKYQDRLMELYEREGFLIPDSRLGELKSFVSSGLKDISISRTRERLNWGIPVPGDDTQVIYVWFDALTNYISTLGWPEGENFKKYWPVVQIAGKDNLRQQAAIWQAMLMSVSVEPSSQIYIHGFITKEGQKMSKSLGNVISPQELIDKYGSDFVRIFLLLHINSFEDSDISNNTIKNSYTADCVNGIGNLILRIMTMSSNNLEQSVKLDEFSFPKEYVEAFETFDFRKVAQYVWKKIGELDARITEKEPFKLIKTDREAGLKEIEFLVKGLGEIAFLLKPIAPNLSSRIETSIKENKPLETPFPRID